MNFFAGLYVVAALLPMVNGLLARQAKAKGDDKCVPLKNRFSFFGVEVAVGTPGQTFEVVADTGSNNVIVPSCVCQEAPIMGCAGAQHCFRGTNKSRTFAVTEEEMNSIVSLTFGSGTIGAILATDMVQVGEETALMEDSLLLMVDDKQLAIEGAFEGILGLGVPTSSFSLFDDPRTEDDIPVAVAQSTSKKLRASREGVVHAESQPHHHHMSQDNPSIEDTTGRVMAQPKSFLEKAGISSFAMCFSEAEEGAMRFEATVPNALQSVGQDHWGVGLTGVKLGGSSDSKALAMPFCQEGAPNAGSATPCGAIPDSGTTLIMGPELQIHVLYANICDQWQRCIDAFSELMQRAEGIQSQMENRMNRILARRASLLLLQQFPASDVPEEAIEGIIPVPENVSGMSEEDQLELELQTVKAGVFVETLMHCASWQEDDTEFSELPVLTWTVVDAQGKTQDIELTPWAYIMETTNPTALEQVNDRRWRSLLQQVPALQGADKVCMASFDTMEYPTRENGMVWILGSPLFYAYEVGFNLDGPSMSFTKLDSTGCQPCSAQTSFLGQESSLDGEGAAAAVAKRRVRQLMGPPRKPKVDTTRPF